MPLRLARVREPVSTSPRKATLLIAIERELLLVVVKQNFGARHVHKFSNTVADTHVHLEIEIPVARSLGSCRI